MAKLKIGMDVGTTNSAVTYTNVETGASGKRVYLPKIIVFDNTNGGILPSCVKYLNRTTVEVGVSAYRQKQSQSVVFSVKRDIWRGNSEIYDVIAENGEEFKVSPIEVTSHILRALTKAVEDQFGGDSFDTLTITVPAYFTETERYNTELAALKAGIKKEHINLINEPTAAALNYGMVNTTGKETILVYDLGGGTFDISMLDIIASNDNVPIFEVITTGGDSRLGGDDIDTALASIALENSLYDILDEIDPEDTLALNTASVVLNKEQMRRINILAESVKKDGSTATIDLLLDQNNFGTQITETLKAAGKNLPLKLTLKLSETEVEEAVRTVFEKTEEIISKTISRYSDKRPTKLLLVGGSTKSAVLQTLLKQKFRDLAVKTEVDPDKAVAKGASIHTAMKESGDSSRLNDIIQSPIGIKVAINNNSRIQIIKQLIGQDKHLPVEGIEAFSTHSDNQTRVSVEIYQGISKHPSQCALLGKLEITDIPPRPAGAITLEVKLHVDLNGLLKITVVQSGTHAEDYRVFEKQLVRLSGVDSQLEQQQRNQGQQMSKVVQKREQVILDTVRDKITAKIALSDFRELTTEVEIREFFKNLEKYNGYEYTAKTEDTKFF